MNRFDAVADLRIAASERPTAPRRWSAESFVSQFVGKFSFLSLAWGVVFALGAVDLAWASVAQIGFTGWSSVVLTVGFLGAIGFAYDYTGRNARLADVGNYAALWVAFSAVGSIFTYVVATMGMPLRDAQLSGIDAALGFQWTPWFFFIAHHRYLNLPLEIAYESMLPQIIGSILYFAHTGQTTRNREFLVLAMLSLVATTLISGLLPAVGPFIPGHQPEFAKMLLSIRAGTAKTFALDNMKGIVTMPSFHTVIALVLIWVHRPPSRSFPIVATLSGLMLLSVPSAGNHYLSDMLAGAVIAAASIAVVTRAFGGSGAAGQLPTSAALLRRG